MDYGLALKVGVNSIVEPDAADVLAGAIFVKTLLNSKRNCSRADRAEKSNPLPVSEWRPWRHTPRSQSQVDISADW